MTTFRRLATLPLMLIALAVLPWLPRSFQPHGGQLALPSARPTPLLRASWFALLALVLGGALLLMATPASAQETVVTLVSNTGQSASGNRAPGPVSHYSQAFDTGSNSPGYNLQSIVLQIGTAATGTGTFTVTVREDASGSPASTVLYTLTNPGTILVGLNEFTAPSGATLDANTTYHVVTKFSDANTGPAWERANLIDGTDSGAAAGWDINAAYLRTLDSGTTWAAPSSSRTLKLQVKGSAIPPPPA